MADLTRKKRPPEPPWPVRAYWWLRSVITWPWQVRQMKRAGFRRIGWMTWQAGPADD